MKRLHVVLATVCLISACSSTDTESSAPDARPTVVVTYSVLGSLVSELVGDAANVTVIIPDGQDPHEFEPSAKDIEALNDARLIVSNGLDFEGGLSDALGAAERRGVAHFVVADHVTTRHGTSPSHNHGDGTNSGDETSAIDPHVWLSPHTMAEMVDDLSSALSNALDVDVSPASVAMIDELDALDATIGDEVDALGSCTLVTGHDELGYFADRYGCTIVGAVIPNFSTTADVSAGQLADLAALVREYDVRAIFTGLGTSADVTTRLSKDLGVPAIELSTHFLLGVSTYEAFMLRLVDQIVGGLS